MLKFCPLSCLLSTKTAERIAVIILNRDITSEGAHPLFSELWKKSVFRACADGGANYIFDIQQKISNGNTPPMPDLVSGDFDSIRPEVKKFYENQDGTEVIKTHDQNETDFTKCLSLVGERLKREHVAADLIVAIGGKQGRFDHSMANISTLYKSREFLPIGVRICLLFGSSYVTLLPEGKSLIEVNTGLEGHWCGLVPVGQPVTVTTTGLKWNLLNSKLEFGCLVSTSNELDGSPEVTVETDHPIIWTMELKTALNL